jgi:hypothetical protein
MGDIIEQAREQLVAKLDKDGEFYSGTGDEPTYRGPSTAQEVADLALNWARQAREGLSLRIATRTEPTDEDGAPTYTDVATVVGNGIAEAPTISGKRAPATRKTAAKKK